MPNTYRYLHIISKCDKNACWTQKRWDATLFTNLKEAGKWARSCRGAIHCHGEGFIVTRDW